MSTGTAAPTTTAESATAESMTAESMTAESTTAESTTARMAVNRRRQREIYGAPLGDRVRTLTAALDVPQGRLAGVLGISPAMLSQLVSGRRIKIGDPTVLARLLVLDQRCHGLRRPVDRATVDALLAEVAAVRWQWSGPRVPPPDARRVFPAASAATALRRLAEPGRLAAAAAVLGPAFPELADVLRRAAGRPRA